MLKRSLVYYLDVKKIAFTYISGVFIIALPYFLKGGSTFFTFFDAGIGRMVLISIHSLIALFMLLRSFYVYRALKGDPYLEIDDESITIRLRHVEKFKLIKYANVCIRDNPQYNVFTVVGDGDPIFSIPYTYLKNKEKILKEVNDFYGTNSRIE